MTHPYRSSVALEALPRWTSPWARIAVRLKRLLFWTLAARRRSWRKHCRLLEAIASGKIKSGLERISIHADNGSVVKNVYVDHGEIDVFLVNKANDYRRGYRERMPRT